MSDVLPKTGMSMLLFEPSQRARGGGTWASLVSAACFLRGLPLFFGGTPKTPLRVLCLIAFDAIHVLRTSKPLPRRRVRILAKFLDFGACANAALDRKAFCPLEYQATQKWLEDAQVASSLKEYLRQLRELERQRPLPGGDQRRFDEVRCYRETVARLSLGLVAALALGDECVEGGVRATHGDPDLATLFKIVMLCQIIDDVLDYAEDRSAGLPSFLTAAASLPQGLQWTAEAAHSYTACRGWPQSASLLPLRLALSVVYLLTRLVLRTRHGLHQMNWAQRLPDERQEQVGQASV